MNLLLSRQDINIFEEGGCVSRDLQRIVSKIYYMQLLIVTRAGLILEFQKLDKMLETLWTCEVDVASCT